MRNERKLDELDVATEIPAAEHLVVPVFDSGRGVIQRIQIGTLATRIRQEVLDGGGIRVVITENGFRFEREEPIRREEVM